MSSNKFWFSIENFDRNFIAFYESPTLSCIYSKLCLNNNLEQNYAQKHINISKQLLKKYLWSIATFMCILCTGRQAVAVKQVAYCGILYMHDWMGWVKYDEGHKNHMHRLCETRIIACLSASLFTVHSVDYFPLSLFPVLPILKSANISRRIDGVISEWNMQASRL